MSGTDLPCRGPSRQTGAICIRHYDDGHNPYTDAKALMDNAVGKPLEPSKFKERFLLQHIADAKALEERKRARNEYLKGRDERSRHHHTMRGAAVKAEPHFGNANGSVSEEEMSGNSTSTTPRNHIATLQAQLNKLDQELWGQMQMVHSNANALDGAMYLEWESECKRYNDGQLWEEAAKDGGEVSVCGTVIPSSALQSVLQPDGKVQLHALLRTMYSNLTEDGLTHLMAAAEKHRPLPLVFGSARSLHRYFAEVVKRFSTASRLSKKSGKPGIDRKEFMAFCRAVRLMTERDACRVFDEFATESSNGAATKIITADELATYFKM